MEIIYRRSLAKLISIKHNGKSYFVNGTSGKTTFCFHYAVIMLRYRNKINYETMLLVFRRTDQPPSTGKTDPAGFSPG